MTGRITAVHDSEYLTPQNLQARSSEVPVLKARHVARHEACAGRDVHRHGVVSGSSDDRQIQQLTGFMRIGNFLFEKSGREFIFVKI
jgi:hypothetical protein